MASHSALPPASEVWMKSRYVVSLSKRGRYGMGSYDVAALAAAAARCILARAVALGSWGIAHTRARTAKEAQLGSPTAAIATPATVARNLVIGLLLLVDDDDHPEWPLWTSTTRPS